MTLFSKRYEQAIFSKRLVVGTVPARARARAWMTMDELNEWRDEVDSTGWQSQTCNLEDTEGFLKREYGAPDLIAFVGDGSDRGVVSFDVFTKRCYPSQFMDVIEVYFSQLGADGKGAKFQQEINRILREENVAWRMSDGEVFKLDSEFLDIEVLARTEELLKENAYKGALDEFREARNDLTAGETREAIAKAQAAFESTMKTILEVSSGTAAELIRGLGDRGFFEDLPEETRAAFGEQVLKSLPTMGNRLGRHGQGADVVEVPRHYAELAVHLAGTFIHYLVERELEIHPPPEPAPPEAATSEPYFGPSDDDIPF